MKISGFSIVKNAIKYNYPVKEAILSILPICDEFIVNVGKSDDDTLQLIQSINSPKIKIFERTWDMAQGEKVLTVETDFALSKCTGDWAFYIQSDEVIHEKDLPILKALMKKNLGNEAIDGFRLRWLHFYISYYRYRIDAGWFQKQVRIIRNNNTICANLGAWGFEKKDGKSLNVIKTRCCIYHYGYVNDLKPLADKIENSVQLGYNKSFNYDQLKEAFNLTKLEIYPAYFGSHPKVMAERIKLHDLSNKDYCQIKKKYFWNPLLWFKVRYKTPKRIKYPLPHIT
jgi:hypothetical protein